MAKAPSRILLNLSLDAALAVVALPVALLLAGPGSWPEAGWWGLGIPLAALSMLAPAWALGLPQQYWRYSGVRDLLQVLGASIGAAFLFTAVLWLVGAWHSPNLAFPALHAMALTGLLGIPRLNGRLRTIRRIAEETGAQPVLVVGGVDQADLFIRALEQERRSRPTGCRASWRGARGRWRGGSRGTPSSAPSRRPMRCWRGFATRGGCPPCWCSPRPT
jgi:FlaA1/EpsC-like NDP-sugar epimerase